MRNLKRGLAGLAALGLVWAMPASADHERDAGVRYAYADVVDVQPIVRYVTVETPVRECYQVERKVRQRRRGSDGNVAGAAIMGGILGGLIGNQFGSGSGRDAATAAGFVIGSSIAAENAKDGVRRSGRTIRKQVRQCDTTYQSHEEERIDGYNVTYVFRGNEYRTRMRRDPGDRIKVRVLVEPVSRD